MAKNIFFLKDTHYLVAVDYFSKYLEVIKLGTMTSRSVIDGLKAMFSRHGIPETVISDNGPQFSSNEFSAFATSYNFIHTTSSPYYPQSNGQAEWTVQTAKRLLTKSDDPYLALLIYRATPLPWCNLSPSQLLMGRHLRTNLPQVQEHLQPKWTYLGSSSNNMLTTSRSRSQLMILDIVYVLLLQSLKTMRCGLPWGKQQVE